MSVSLQRMPIRAPRGHGEAVIEPPLAAAPALAAANRELLRHSDYDVQGIPLGRLMDEARRELFAAAYRYTTAYRDVALPDATSSRPGGAGHSAHLRRGPADHSLPDGAAELPLILTGHQPQLFHAGVWFKNFALSTLGRRLGAVAVNLLVDNDILQTAAVRVPGGDGRQPRIEAIAFDEPAYAIPYEERTLLAPALFASFGDRVAAYGGRHLPAPLVRQLWPLARDAARRTANVGRCLAEARHRLEGQWGQQTLEVPLSVVCDGPAFRRFACHLLAHLPRWQGLHNACLAEYRRGHRVRSRSHPVPELATDGEWREAPFWLWTAAAPARRRLFVRTAGRTVELSDRTETACALTLSAEGDAQTAVEQLAAWSAAGVRLRPRALITTLFARLVLGDLFLHGIGGAKYDQLTDLIVARFFGLRPPAFLTLSATALLFPDRTAQLQQQLRGTRQMLRELRFHPERHLPAGTEATPLVAEKRQWLARELPRGARRVRHQALERINLALQTPVAAARQRLVADERRLSTAVRDAARLASREFSFCLFSEESLRPLLLDLSGAAATLVSPSGRTPACAPSEKAAWEAAEGGAQ